MGRITGVALKLDLTLTTPISICYGCQYHHWWFLYRKQRLKDLWATELNNSIIVKPPWMHKRICKHHITVEKVLCVPASGTTWILLTVDSCLEILVCVFFQPYNTQSENITCLDIFFLLHSPMPNCISVPTLTRLQTIFV